MADILIRGMEMPETCDECPMYTCMHNRADCPLHELPPHGDLIDRDWLKGMAYSKVDDFGGAFIDTLDLAIAPVIVPSNKEGSE